jgi:hypothetical protein
MALENFLTFSFFNFQNLDVAGIFLAHTSLFIHARTININSHIRKFSPIPKTAGEMYVCNKNFCGSFCFFLLPINYTENDRGKTKISIINT